MHGTYETLDGRPAVRFERRFDHPVDAVWRAVTDPGEMEHWFPARVTADMRAGGAMSFQFPDESMPVTEGEVLELDPPRRFAFRWADDELHFHLEPEGDGERCRFRLTHILASADQAARDASGWHVCVEQLSKHLNGEPAQGPGTEMTDELRALYDDYVARGLPSGAEMPGDG